MNQETIPEEQSRDDAAAKSESGQREGEVVSERPPPRVENEGLEVYNARVDAWLGQREAHLLASFSGNIQKFSDALKKATRAAESAKSDQVVAALTKKVETAKCFPTFEEVCQTNIFLRNETDSSAHTSTGHETASHKLMEIPSVDVPAEFWEQRVSLELSTIINGEAGVNADLRTLLQDITRALGLGSHLQSMLDVPIIDTVPDVTMVSKLNKRMSAVVEGKKPPRTEMEKSRIFGSGTEVAGESFEQLFLMSMQNETFAVGMIATLQTFQLVCTRDVGKETLTVEDAVEYFETKKVAKPKTKTPNKRKVVSDQAILRGSGLHNSGAKVTAKPKNEKKEGRGTKRGRVAIAITKENVKRSFFATEAISFGSNEAENRKVIELLVAFILLGVKTLTEAPSGEIRLPKKGEECLARKVSLSQGNFAFKEIVMPDGIAFGTNPTKQHTNFFAIRQLGYGQFGASCFACTEASAAPCVIKFYRDHVTFEHALEEQKRWNHLYGEYGFDFVRASKSPRVLLVMPYLRVPRNQEERQKLLEGEEKGLLYQALQHVADKERIHDEVFWHHVGLIEVPTRGTVAVFCDLQHVYPCKDVAKRNQWVKDAFAAMKQRI